MAGTRTFSDRDLLYSKLDFYLQGKPALIISGGAKGADELGEEYARDRGLHVKLYLADWKQYGIAAGPMRNEEMAKAATHCVVFWDGKSKGTGSMIKLAEKYNLNLRIVRYSP